MTPVKECKLQSPESSSVKFSISDTSEFRMIKSIRKSLPLPCTQLGWEGTMAVPHYTKLKLLDFS